MKDDDLKTQSTEQILAAISTLEDFPAVSDRDEWLFPMMELQRRGTRDIFEAVKLWAVSPDPKHRAFATDVLGQFDYAGGKRFAKETAPLIDTLLGDPDENVVAAALIALSHLGSAEVDVMLPFHNHHNAKVRYAAAVALEGRIEPSAVQALIALSHDSDSAVRDWATFALGSQSDADTPDIREALHARLSDPDEETRGEAIIGLAKRRDARVVPVILEALQQGSVFRLVIRACGIMPDARYAAALTQLADKHPDDDDVRRALAACTSGVPDPDLD